MQNRYAMNRRRGAITIHFQQMQNRTCLAQMAHFVPNRCHTRNHLCEQPVVRSLAENVDRSEQFDEYPSLLAGTESKRRLLPLDYLVRVGSFSTGF
jgi:hypothetical protein